MNYRSHLPILFKRIRSFWFGCTLPISSARLILAKPQLIFWSVLPIVITLFLYFFLIQKAQDVAKNLLIYYFLQMGLDPTGIILKAVLLMSRVFLWILSMFTFSFIASVASSPFNDILAECTEKWTMPSLKLVSKINFKEKLKLIGIDLLKTIATAIAVVVALSFSWLPVINIIVFVLAFLLLTFQYLSYPQTRRSEDLKHSLKFLWKHLYACLGFGVSFSVLFAIPLLSSLALPLAVVGGTLLYARAQRCRAQECAHKYNDRFDLK
ncbi:MAG: EI24 domain-containing protein [Bdellovibrio sp.]|nr:EI24 domain-containing protein [Bdellovibrio sp.]